MIIIIIIIFFLTQLDTGGKSGVSSPRRGDCCSVSPPSVGGGWRVYAPPGVLSVCVVHNSFYLFSYSLYLSGVLKRLTYSFDRATVFLFTLSTLTLACVLVTWLRNGLTRILLFSNSYNHGHRWMRTETCTLTVNAFTGYDKF